MNAKEPRLGSAGFTLIEALTAIAILGIVLTLSAGALRHFWLVQSLDSATNEVVTQLRQLQEQAISENYPRVYGARFRKGTSEWASIRFDPGTNPDTSDDTCTQVRSRSFGSGVFSAAVTVGSATDFAASSEATFCSTNLRDTANNLITVTVNDEFAFFYAKGSAVSGSVTLEQTTLGRAGVVTVAPLTGRVTRT